MHLGSKWVKKEVQIVANRRPLLDGLVHTMPIQMVKNSFKNITFTGAVDPDGDNAALKYALIDPVNVSFDKVSNISAGEAVKATMPDLNQDVAGSFSVQAVDAQGLASVAKVVNFTVLNNSVPDISGLVHNVPVSVGSSKEYTVKFSGATDSESDDSVLEYELVDLVNVSFNKSSSIGVNENVTLSIGVHPNNTVASFNVCAIDAHGGRSEKKAVTLTITNVVQGANGDDYQGGIVIMNGKGLLFYKTPSVTKDVTLPLGVREFTAHVGGAGGAAGDSASGGGGGGGYARKKYNIVTEGAVVAAVSVGPRGTVPSNAGPSVSGTSSFSIGSNIVSATGGQNGWYEVPSGATGKLGGMGVGGDVNYRGGPGGSNAGDHGNGGGGGAAGGLGDGEAGGNAASSASHHVGAQGGGGAFLDTVGGKGGAGAINNGNNHVHHVGSQGLDVTGSTASLAEIVSLPGANFGAGCGHGGQWCGQGYVAITWD